MFLKGINDNPLSNKWKKRYSIQSDEVKEKLDALNQMNPKDYQLRSIKKSNVAPRDGDIFVLSPREDIFFYGKVLNAEINHLTKDTFINGNCLVFLFNRKTTELNSDKFKAEYDNLLISPVIVTNNY